MGYVCLSCPKKVAIVSESRQVVTLIYLLQQFFKLKCEVFLEHFNILIYGLPSLQILLIINSCAFIVPKICPHSYRSIYCAYLDTNIQILHINSTV